MYRLHGNVPQNVRQTVYKDFCKAKSGIMLCTDVAARGLDLPEVHMYIYKYLFIYLCNYL
jgi:superfamily II DNA/RNA helicase